MKSIHDEVFDFYNKIKGDSHHRYKSWEHCYQYFGEPNPDIDTAALHLAFYLASWGMYRGSTDLIWKDYKVHTNVVEHVLKKRKDFQSLDLKKCDDKALSDIISIRNEIAEIYKQQIRIVNGKEKTANAGQTYTLISKVMLGTLGCVPAYDEFFKRGLKEQKMSARIFDLNSLEAIQKHYNEHQEEFDDLQKEIRVGKKPYPTMKLIDMYFWQIGKKAVEKEKRAKKKGAS